MINGNFKIIFKKLKEKERSLMARSSDPIKDCMQLKDDTLIKHNYYADKFDCTAWNDFDAIPRAASTYGLDNHGGSRKRLLFSRRQGVINMNNEKLDETERANPHFNFCRSNLITNVAIENT